VFALRLSFCVYTPVVFSCLHSGRLFVHKLRSTCLYTYEFWLSLCKIVRSSVILLLPLCIHCLRFLCSHYGRLFVFTLRLSFCVYPTVDFLCLHSDCLFVFTLRLSFCVYTTVDFLCLHSDCLFVFTLRSTCCVYTPIVFLCFHSDCLFVFTLRSTFCLYTPVDLLCIHCLRILCVQSDCLYFCAYSRLVFVSNRPWYVFLSILWLRSVRLKGKLYVQDKR
jgi:hypothetical protein